MKDDGLYLIHISECIDRIERYTTGGKDDYMNSTNVRSGVAKTGSAV